jgi:hypothetical protein
VSAWVLPNLSGRTFPLGRAVEFVTLSDTSLSRRVATLALQQYAVHTYNLAFSLLRDDVAVSEVRQLVGLFNAMNGRFDSFLYTDPVFNTVADEPFGVGDGVATNFQVIATLKNTGGTGGADIIQNFNGLPTFKDNGSAAGTTVLGPTGIVQFFTPPAAGHVLTWSGQFYQRCHFMNDTLSVYQTLKKWWVCDGLAFQSVLL